MKKNMTDILRTKATLNFALSLIPLTATILIRNDSLTSEESKAKSRLWIPYGYAEQIMSIRSCGHKNSDYGQTLISVFPYSTKMLLTHSTY